MGYSISVDSGGSKTLAILYDSDFRPVSEVRTGSLRGNTTPKYLIEKHRDECISGLFDSLVPGQVTAIDSLRGSYSSHIRDGIQARAPISRYASGGEGRLGLAAAGLREGLVALSGTGATMFLHSEKYGNAHLGGYGAIVADEGSGYHIGRMAMIAAIHHDEGRGEATSLLDRICELLGTCELHRGIFQTIYAPDSLLSPAAWVASVCRIVSEEAVKGDRVAQDILRHAGRLLGEQMNALIRKYNVGQELPLTISGSVYKGSRIVFDEMCRIVRQENPERPIVLPLMEPVVGAIMDHYLEEHESLDEEARAFFTGEYSKYLYQLGK